MKNYGFNRWTDFSKYLNRPTFSTAQSLRGSNQDNLIGTDSHSYIRSSLHNLSGVCKNLQAHFVCSPFHDLQPFSQPVQAID